MVELRFAIGAFGRGHNEPVLVNRRVLVRSVVSLLSYDCSTVSAAFEHNGSMAFVPLILLWEGTSLFE